MDRQSIHLGRIFGIPIGIDASWFMIFILVSWTLATGYYPNEFKNWPVFEYWVVGVLTAILFFGSVLLHEVGHALAAQRFQIPVRRITLYIFGGISEMKIEPTTALSEFWVTLAGPIVNLALAGLLAVLSMLAAGWAPALALLKYLTYINLMLGLFNLIPGYPLDGGGVLMSIIWGVTGKKRLGTLVAASIGSIIANLFILWGVYQIFNGSLLNGLWTAFIGWFLLNASRAAIRREKLKEVLAGHKVSEAMSLGYTVIYAQTLLQTLVDEHILGSSLRSFIVKKDEQVVGLLTLHDLQKISKDAWPTTTVDQVMTPTAEFKQISPDTELWDALEEMDRDGVNQLPVMAKDQIRGMLTREDVISYLRKLPTSVF